MRLTSAPAASACDVMRLGARLNFVFQICVTAGVFDWSGVRRRGSSCGGDTAGRHAVAASRPTCRTDLAVSYPQLEATGQEQRSASAAGACPSFKLQEEQQRRSNEERCRGIAQHARARWRCCSRAAALRAGASNSEELPVAFTCIAEKNGLGFSA